MNLNKAILYTTFLGVLFSSSAVLADENEQLNTSFISPEGIHFESYSKEWDSTKLKELYQMLLENAHGEELKYLSTIKVSSEEPKEGKSKIVGDFDPDWYINEQDGFRHLKPGRTITLYYANRFTSIEDMAYTLSHEYGHLFTYYWLDTQHKQPETMNCFYNDEWTALRGIQNDFPIRWDSTLNSMSYNHFWQPEEIMANDYVALFGSPEAKEKIFYSPEMKDIDMSFISGIDNMIIPSPEGSKGLREYWENLSGINTKTDNLSIPKIISLKTNGSTWGTTEIRVKMGHMLDITSICNPFIVFIPGFLLQMVVECSLNLLNNPRIA